MTKERAAHIILNLIQKEEETGSYSLLKVEVDALKKAYCSLVPELFTNADRIRSMTDEELAWFIYTKTGCDHKCMHWKSKSCSDPDSAKVCGEVWLEWLKQEIKTN